MHTSRTPLIAALLLLTAMVPGLSGADSALKPRTARHTPPPLVLLDRAGKRHALEDYGGKVVVVNFFGTWCPPCLQEMPSLLLLAEALKDQPFAVLAVDVGDSPARLWQVFGKERAAFTILLDSTQSAVRSWGAKAFPISFVVDPEGRIRYTAEGPVQWDDPKVAKPIVELLPKAPSSKADNNAGGSKASQSAAPQPN
jgi:thiol-disulfide isomerase/thioredoxin